MYNHDLGKTQCWFTPGIDFVSADQVISEQKVLNNRTTKLKTNNLNKSVVHYFM